MTTQPLSIGTVSVYPLIDQRIRHPGNFQLLLDILRLDRILAPTQLLYVHHLRYGEVTSRTGAHNTLWQLISTPYALCSYFGIMPFLNSKC